MISTKQKINRFLRVSRQYKKFIDIVSFIISLLTPEQLKILEIQYEGEVIDFKTQLSLALENRYKNRYWDIEELKARSTKALNKYKFLFETNLSPLQIRTSLLKELVEVISFGFLCNDMYDQKVHGKRKRYFSDVIKSKYPRLPPRKKGKGFIYFWEECFDCIHTLSFKNENIKDLWYSEFFKKTKWYFEQLNSCEPEYINKYRERIYEEIRFAMDIWNNESFKLSPVERSEKYSSYDLYISKVKININIHLQKLVEEILSYFSTEELASLKKIDSEGNVWSFKEQLLSRYYSKYPSFVSLEEIKPQIKEKVEQYKPLLLIENKKETIKELFLDELERGIFVSKNTYFWNKVMFKNLNIPRIKTRNIDWAVQRILDSIGPENEKAFYLEIEGKKYDLKTLLTARWMKAKWGEHNHKQEEFKDKAFSVFYLETVKGKDMSKLDMQVFLEKLDFFFLTPKGLTRYQKRVHCFMFLVVSISLIVKVIMHIVK